MGEGGQALIYETIKVAKMNDFWIYIFLNQLEMTG